MTVTTRNREFREAKRAKKDEFYTSLNDIELELQNRHVEVSAFDVQGALCHQCVADEIAAQAQATAIFTKIILVGTACPRLSRRSCLHRVRITAGHTNKRGRSKQKFERPKIRTP